MLLAHPFVFPSSSFNCTFWKCGTFRSGCGIPALLPAGMIQKHTHIYVVPAMSLRASCAYCIPVTSCHTQKKNLNMACKNSYIKLIKTCQQLKAELIFKSPQSVCVCLFPTWAALEDNSEWVLKHKSHTHHSQDYAMQHFSLFPCLSVWPLLANCTVDPWSSMINGLYQHAGTFGKCGLFPAD